MGGAGPRYRNMNLLTCDSPHRCARGVRLPSRRTGECGIDRAPRDSGSPRSDPAAGQSRRRLPRRPAITSSRRTTAPMTGSARLSTGKPATLSRSMASPPGGRAARGAPGPLGWVAPGPLGWVAPGLLGWVAPGLLGWVAPGPLGWVAPGPLGWVAPGPLGWVAPGPLGWVAP